MDIYDVLRRPVVTEKNALLAGQNKYVFEVARDANKPLIREAVETAFKVRVTAVNVIHMPGKMRTAGRRRGMTPAWKKAIVTLESGHKIELYEGV